MEALRRFDHKMTLVIQELPARIRYLMSGASFLGEPIVVLTVAFGGFILSLYQASPASQRAFFYATLAYGINTLLKLVLHRRRPHDLKIWTLGLRSYSFPSGHAFGSVIFYGLLSYLSFEYLSNALSLALGIMTGIILVLIGLSRVYLQAHYPTDVVGGWLLGGISLFAVITIAF